MHPTSFSKSLISGAKTLFTGSEPNFYLEHKVASTYHTQGEKQAIILNEITLGRASDCNVRFDESFSHVSRYHARILRKDNKWTLVHLSNTNKTFLNGKPVNGEWFLQDGDEIQLAENGPRLVFQMPAKEEKNEFGMTARFDQFKQQVVRPYRTWMWIISCIIVLLIGLGIWNGMRVQKELEALRMQIRTVQSNLDNVGSHLDSLTILWDNTQSKLDERIKESKREIAILKSSNKKNTQKAAQMQADLDTLRKNIANTQNDIDILKTREMKLRNEIQSLQKAIELGSTNAEEMNQRIAATQRKLDELQKKIQEEMMTINNYYGPVTHGNIGSGSTIGSNNTNKK